MARLLLYRLETPETAVFERARGLLNMATENGSLRGIDPAGVSVELSMRMDALTHEEAA
jgi:hypothetical protein